MNSKIFNSLEIDAIGEILNISLGASATAISTMLSKRVDITTPSVQVVTNEEFVFTNLEPAVGVEITYLSGLQGKNLMLLKRQDVKTIVELLMGYTIADEDFELDEMNLSAICEVMNQMMGSSSTALSEFLGESVNISTPRSFEIQDAEEFKKIYFEHNEPMIVVGFVLKIEKMVESEFLNVMPIGLAKKLLSAFGLQDEQDEKSDDTPKEEPALEDSNEQNGGSGVMSQSEIEKLLGSVSEQEQKEPQEESPEEPKIEASSKKLTQDEIEKLLKESLGEQKETQPVNHMAEEQMVTENKESSFDMQPSADMQQQMMQQMQQMMQQMMQQQTMQKKSQEPKVINVKPLVHTPLNDVAHQLGQEQAENLALIMEVPLEISVEIGKTKKMVKDILELVQGSLVVLDKLAGEQVDLFVNGQCIAKGDVVVVDDNFGVRVTEIIKKPDLSTSLKFSQQ